MCTRFFGSKQGNLPLYHTQVMTIQELITLKPCDQVPYFYISFDSQEAIEYISKFKIFEDFKIKNKNSQKRIDPYLCWRIN